MLAISKQELWDIRHSIETGDEELQDQALSTIESILAKNVQVSVTADQMYKDPLELTEQELIELEATDVNQ